MEEIYKFNANDASNLVEERVDAYTNKLLEQIAKGAKDGRRDINIWLDYDVNYTKSFYVEVCDELKKLGFYAKFVDSIWYTKPYFRVKWKRNKRGN